MTQRHRISTLLSRLKNIATRLLATDVFLMQTSSFWKVRCINDCILIAEFYQPFNRTQKANALASTQRRRCTPVRAEVKECFHDFVWILTGFFFVCFPHRPRRAHAPDRLCRQRIRDVLVFTRQSDAIRFGDRIRQSQSRRCCTAVLATRRQLWRL